MSTYSPARLIQTQALTASAATYYTVPGSTTSIIKQFTIANTDTVARTVTVNNVASAGSASASNQIIPGITIAPNSFEVIDLNIVMATGGFISAVASSAGVVTITASGIEVTA